MSETEREQEIGARWAKATPGPWGVLESNRSNLAHVETQEGCEPCEQGFTVCSIPKKRLADAEAIAAAPSDVAWLLDQLRTERARAERAEAERDADRKRFVEMFANAHEQMRQAEEHARSARYWVQDMIDALAPAAAAGSR